MTAAHVIFLNCSLLLLCLPCFCAYNLCPPVSVYMYGGSEKNGFPESEIYSQIVYMKVVRERTRVRGRKREKYKTLCCQLVLRPTKAFADLQCV